MALRCAVESFWLQSSPAKGIARLLASSAASLHEPAKAQGPPIDPFTQKLAEKADKDLQALTDQPNSTTDDGDEDLVDVRIDISNFERVLKRTVEASPV